MKLNLRHLTLALLATLAIAFSLMLVQQACGPLAAAACALALFALPSFRASAICRMALTTARDTQVRDAIVASYPLAAATKIYLGAMVALDSSGNAVNAADTTALRVVGRAEQTVDNTTGLAGDLAINVRRGCFKWTNSAAQVVTAAYKDKFVYVEDNETVAIASTNFIVAGRVIEVATDGVWVDSTDKPIAAKAATTVGSAVATTAATNSSPYGYTTAAQADAIVANINALRTDVLALAAKLNG